MKTSAATRGATALRKDAPRGGGGRSAIWSCKASWSDRRHEFVQSEHTRVMWAGQERDTRLRS